jgi:hypothetical protein
MRQLIAIFVCLMFTSLVHSAEATRAKLTGVWWGTMTGDNRASPAYNRFHWTVERKADGTYRLQGFRVDHEKKLFCILHLESGKWELKDGILRYTTQTGSAQPLAVRWEDGKVRFERKHPPTGGVSNEQICEECSEESVEKFGSRVPDDYRELSLRDFDARGADTPPAAVEDW